MDDYARGYEAGAREMQRNLAEVQRKRIESGMQEAKERGVKLGRPPKTRPAEFEKVKAAWTCGKMSSKIAAKQLGIAQDTFLRWCRTPNPEMSIECALEILENLSRNMDSEGVKAIRVITTYIIEQRNKRIRRLQRSKKGKGDKPT